MRRAINLAGKFYPRLTNQVNRTMIGSFVVQSPSAAVNRILVRTCKTAASDKPSDSQGKNEETDSKDSRSERTDVAVFDHDNYDDYYEPKTAGEKVSFYTVLSLRMLLLLAGVACVVVTARELFPGRLGPQNLFSEAFEVVKLNDEIRAMIGDSMKAFGRDTGRNTEGRRNHVDSRKYDGEDGSKRLRVRFYVQGTRGKMLVWAEVSNQMADNEFVYLICQDLRTGKVVTIEDNRQRLDANQLARGEDGDIMKKISSIIGRN